MTDADAPELDHLRRLFLDEVGMTHDRAPDAIGPYLLIEEIGRGATGTVWRALHTGLLEDVALKVLDRERIDADAAARFRREALLTARLRHPNIVRVRDAGADDDRSWIAMDLVPGEGLREWFTGEPELRERLLVVERVARAVHAAHEASIIHRDLKPENVIVRDDGEPVVLDFGMARQLGRADVSAEGTAVGTPVAMAPEVVRGEAGSASSDVWSLGVMLFESVTGHPPFTGRTAAEVWSSVLETAPALPPGPIGAVIGCALAPSANDRHADAGALADDIAAVREGRALGVGPRWSRRRRSIVVRRIAAALATLLVVGVVVTLAGRDRDAGARAAEEVAAHDGLTARLHGSMIDAALLRYAPDVDARRDLEASIENVIARADAPDSVREALRAWTAFLLGRDASKLDALVSRRPDDPLARTYSARRHLLQWAESAPWPDVWVTMHPISDPLHAVTAEASPARRARLDAALSDLDAARGTARGRLLSTRAMAEELAAACGAYAEGAMDECSEALEALEGHAELSVEAWHLNVLARVRDGDLDRASATAERFVLRHPRLRPARRLALECRKLRAMVDLASPRPRVDDLLAARAHGDAAHPDARAAGAHADLDRMIGEARRRRGEESAADLRRAITGYDARLEREPRDARALAARGQCRLALMPPGGRRLDGLVAALADLEKAHAIEPRHGGIAAAWIGVRIERHRLASATGVVEEATWDGVAADVTTIAGISETERLYIKTILSLARGEAASHAGRSGAEHLETARQGAAALLGRQPQFAEARRLALTAQAFLVRDVVTPPDPARAVEVGTGFAVLADDVPAMAWTRAAGAEWLSSTLRGWQRRRPASMTGRPGLDAWRHAVELWTGCRDAAATRGVLLGRARALEALAGHPACTEQPRRLDEALAAREALLTEDPTHIDSYAAAGRLCAELASLGNASPTPPAECIEDALEFLADGIDRDPRHIECRLVRARVRAALRRQAAARADLDAAAASATTEAERASIAAIRRMIEGL